MCSINDLPTFTHRQAAHAQTDAGPRFWAEAVKRRAAVAMRVRLVVLKKLAACDRHHTVRDRPGLSFPRRQEVAMQRSTLLLVIMLGALTFVMGLAHAAPPPS